MGELERGCRAGAIAGHELMVRALECLAIERSLLDQELDPCLVAVDGQQGVVEIEQGEDVVGHDRIRA